LEWFLIIRLVLILNLFSLSLFATTIRSEICGAWTNPATWDLNRVPVSTDTIVVSNFVQFDTDFTSEEPGFLHVTKSGMMCGQHTYTGSFIFSGPSFVKKLVHYYGRSFVDTNLVVTERVQVTISGSVRVLGNGGICVGCSAVCDSCKVSIATLPQKEEEVKNEIPLCKVTFPNLLIMNGSEKNRNFIPGCLSSLKFYELHVFNRWGKLVFNSNQDDDWWNGCDNSGKALSNGVYYYVFEYNLTGNSSFTSAGFVRDFVEILNSDRKD